MTEDDLKCKFCGGSVELVEKLEGNHQDVEIYECSECGCKGRVVEGGVTTETVRVGVVRV